MAGLLLGCAANPIGLGLLPARKTGLGLQQHGGLEQPQQHLHSSTAASCFAVAAACSDGLTAAAVVAELGSLSCSSVLPPRVANHTRRLVVPAAGPYQLASTRTRQRRGRSGPGGGGGDDDDIWGGDGGSGGGNDFWGGGDGSGDEGDDSGSMAARLQDLLLLWSLFCGLAFCQAVVYVSPKPKAVAPAFAALSFSGIKASLLQRRSPAQAAC